MNRLAQLSVVLVVSAMLCSCGNIRTADAEATVHELLDGGARNLNCDKSLKMMREERSRNGIFRDTNACNFPREERFMTITDEYVNAVSRCTIDDIDAEYSVTVFKNAERNDYYGGYFCSVAQGKNFLSQKIGSLTEKEGPL